MLKVKKGDFVILHLLDHAEHSELIEVVASGRVANTTKNTIVLDNWYDPGYIVPENEAPSDLTRYAIEKGCVVKAINLGRIEQWQKR